MTNKNISSLFPATTPLVSTEILAIVQSGTTVNVTVADLTAGRNVSMADLTTTGNTTLGNVTTNTFNVGAGGIVKDASGNVGIGVAVPAVKLDVGGVSPTIRIRDTQNKTPWVIGDVIGALEWYSSDASAPGAKAVSSIKTVADISSNAASGALVFSTSTSAGTVTERFRIDSSGNLIQGTAAKGINFTANTPAAGMTSQLLNWYEEGTWTGTLVGSTSSPTVPVTATGGYVRIGKQVTFNIGFINVTTTGAAGNVTVTGLPFTSTRRSVHSTSTYLFDLNTGTSVVSQIEVGATTLTVLASKTNAAWALVQHSAGTGRYLNISGSYITA